MSDASIQIRRITERVKRFYTIFGFTNYTRLSKTKSVISGSRRLGFDEVECVVSETARGTSVGFYKINSIQSIFYAIPILLPLILLLADKNSFVNENLTEGKGLLAINYVKLIAGGASLNFNFFVIIIGIAAIPVIIELYNQQIRLANLKSRFSFFTRDAVWDTREISPQMIILQSVKSAISHSYMLAILYFAVFSFTDSTLDDVTTIYRTTPAEINSALISAFAITSGMIIGLISADKALRIRRATTAIDSRSRYSGSLTERRLEPILFACQASVYSAVLFAALMSQTFMVGAPIDAAIQMILASLVGGFVASLFREERTVWVAISYALLVFLTSLIFIFRTGNQSEYAFVVILQLFILPIPFIIELSRNFGDLLQEKKITSREWLYDIFPLTALISFFNSGRRTKRTQKDYEARVAEGEIIELEDPKIKLTKSIFQDSTSNSYKLARHYFELLVTYTASFEEDALVLIPTNDQLLNWWSERANQKFDTNHELTISTMDQLLWDPDYLPAHESLAESENIGKTMVFAIQ